MTLLHARATEGEGVDQEELDDAMDSADPKAALVHLLLEAAASAAKNQLGESDAALRAEIHGMKLMALHQRALEEGVEGARLEDAMESEAPKQALVELLLRAK